MRFTRLKLWKIIPICERSSRIFDFEDARHVEPFTSRWPEVSGTNPLIGPHHRRLAGAGQSDDHDELTVGDLEAEVLQRVHATAVGDRGVLEADHAAPDAGRAGMFDIPARPMSRGVCRDPTVTRSRLASLVRSSRITSKFAGLTGARPSMS